MRITNQTFDEERALYGISGAEIQGCRFDGPADGESAFKEASDLQVTDCYFNLRYPFWHVTNAVITRSEMTEKCRAALWYDKKITIDGCTMNGIKALRECEDITLKNTIVSSPEFIWKCRNISVENVTINESEYPFFEVTNLTAKNLRVKGKYSFQYTEDTEITDSVLETKDAFWHSKNVTVRDSVINGEYLGWYSENLRLINCTIAGTQPLCYCKNLVLENCTLKDADLAFEKSSVRASLNGTIISVKNPLSGSISAEDIGEVIIDETCDASKTRITTLRRNA